MNSRRFRYGKTDRFGADIRQHGHVGKSNGAAAGDLVGEQPRLRDGDEMRVGLLAHVGVGQRAAAADLVHDDRFEHAVFLPDFLDDARGLVVAAARRGEYHQLNGALGFPCLRSRRDRAAGERYGDYQRDKPCCGI